MMIDRFTPILGPGNQAMHRDLAFPIDIYGERFVDLDFWRPIIDLVAAEHGLPVDKVTVGEPGTFPTFILDRSHVIKFFGAPFDGLRCWAVELEVAGMLDRAGVAIPVPDLVAAGVLSRAPDWRYTIATFVHGEPFARIRTGLGEEARLHIARDLGIMLRRLHDIVIPSGTVFGDGWNEWTSFVDRHRHGVAARHRRWNVLSERLIGQIERYVADYRASGDVAPSLVHADLHAHHLLGEMNGCGRWGIRGVIDWGDAMVGDRYQELPALHLGLFHGDKAMLAAFLESYGWDDYRSDAFVRRAMTLTLLHEFNVLEKVAEMVDLTALESLDQLADTIWRG